MNTTYILGHYLIAGMSHQSKEKINWWKIDRETAIQLHRERHNPYDPLAVSIRLPDGKRLGYLRRDDTKVPSSLLDQGAQLEARVVEISRSEQGEPYEVQVELALVGEAE